MIFDIETDGFNPTKIHVLSWKDQDGVHSTKDYDEMRGLLMGASELAGHNIIRYDIPALHKIIGFKPSPKQVLIDTLPLSWYLNPHRSRHGLEFYGEDYGVPKPKIDDWNSLTYEDYAHRCEEDVKINDRLYKELMYKLKSLYKDEQVRNKFTHYLMFKMKCAADQERLKWKLDVPKAKSLLSELEALEQDKVKYLTEAMPKRPVYKVKNRPKITHKQDGSMSARYEAWLEFLKGQCLPDTTETCRYIDSYVDANPNSTDQVKEWLYSMGWEPCTFKYVKDKSTGDERKIEQVLHNGELTLSVTRLAEQIPQVNVLEGLSVIKHRIGTVKSFIECEKDGYLEATIAGLTNTLRFKHARPLVNLPSVDKPWGKEIRGCLIAPKGMILCGADMTSLEDTTKRHYMKPLDPKYVEEMSREGFDPHLDLAKHAGKVTQEDIDKHNSGEVSLKALRKNYKVVNYSATYGVGAAKLSRETGLSHKEAKDLIEAFWKRNWAIQAVADELTVREIDGENWLLNPVSGFYHSLRSDKDRFSTLNQSTGVYCFDRWVYYCKSRGLNVIGQFHDEIIVLLRPETKDEVADIMKGAIKTVNQITKLNVPLDVDYSFGLNYAEVH